jgi:hypothetical protein
MSIDLKRLTYDAYLAMPEMKQRYSIIDGELVMAASPNPPPIGIREAWVVSPEARTVEVLQLAGAVQHLGLYGLGDLLASQVLPDLRLTVDDIFPELDFAWS